jgi:PAS domain S-box-containing protein
MGAKMPKVLIADDEVIIAMQLEDTLKLEGYAVVGTALSGAESIEMAKRLRPDLVLMDIVMPGKLDGIAAAEIIKAELEIPIIFLTAYAENQFVERAKQVEPLAYIVKPFQEREVLAAIEIALYKKEMDLRLRESENRYALAVSAGKVGVWDWDLETNEIYIDPNLKGMLDYADHEIRNNLESWKKLLHPDDLEQVMTETNAYIGGLRLRYAIEHRMLRKNGSIRWFYTQGSAIQNEQDRPFRIIGTSADITERKRVEAALQKANDQLEQRVKDRTVQLNRINEQLKLEIEERRRSEEQLRESEEKYRQLFESESDAVLILDAETSQFEEANQAALDLFGYTKKEFLALRVEDISNGKNQTRAVLRNILRDEPGSKKISLRYFKKKDASIFPGEISAGLFISKGRKKIIGAVRDITDRKRAEDHIHTLTQQLMKVQESERRKISRDLHDNVAQDLSTLKIACDTLFDHQPSVSSEIRRRAADMSSILQGTIVAVRDIAYDLRPPGLDQLGLAKAIFQQCEEFSEKHAVKVDFFAAGLDDLKINFDTEINLYRLVQEALSNIRKHANANHVIIRMVASHPNIILRIEDDGQGFDVEERLVSAENEKRMGLRSMQERVSLLSGDMRILSRLKDGTKIIIEVPYKEEKRG